MDLVLLNTRLRPPALRRRLVSRPQLLELLDRGLRRKLTLIAAPAGYGKTTLLASWLAVKNQPSAWLALDAYDDSLSRLLAYLAGSLQQVLPGAGEQALEMLRAPGPVRTETLLTMLINNLADQTDDLVMVLDDCHHLTQLEIHRALDFFIQHMPPQVHLYLSGRTVPPLQISLLRSRHQLLEIGVRQLRFEAQESRTFLHHSMGLKLETPVIEHLHHSTEGWVAGLQLAGLAAQTRFSAREAQDQAEYLEAFSGDQQQIFDYLMTEVLEKQPQQIQQFLLRTSILSELDSELCAAVADNPSSREILLRLERTNLFTFAIDDRRRRYRYHPLFREFLRARAEDVLTEKLTSLHLQAARWYANQGLDHLAIQYGFQAGDLNWTAKRIAARASRMWTYQETRQLREWIEALPAEHLRINPTLLLYLAWSRIMTGDLLQSAEPLSQAEQNLAQQSARQGELAGVAAVVRATLYMQTNRADPIPYYQIAARTLPESAGNWLGAAHLGLGMAHLQKTGDLEQARTWLAAAVAINRAIGNHFAAFYASYFLGETQFAQGNLAGAESTHRHTVQSVVASPDVSGLMASWGLLGLGEVLRERGQFEAAAGYLVEAIQLGRQRDNKETIIKSLIGLAKIAMADQNWTEAAQLLAETQRQAQQPGIPDLTDQVRQAQRLLTLRHSQSTNVWPAAGRPGSNDHELRNPLDGEPLPLWLVPESLLTVREWIAAGEYSLALARLAQLKKSVSRQVRSLHLEISVLQALALAGAQKESQALVELRPALVLAAKTGFQRLLLDEGEPLLRLLHKVDGSGQASVYAQSLLTVAGSLKVSRKPVGSALIDPLSETELEILQLLSEGLTNEQIAAQRVVSINTVKWHLKNIYGKLGVSNRTAAVARGRELSCI